jgi:glutamate formiminotransferase/glutamate formiminotransferase/formiminotetrahydrofolate cyclodeaminase
MDRIVECVPNFSEGRDPATVQALVDAVASVRSVRLLDRTMDRDHHRSVLTFIGDPEAIVEAAFRTIRAATDLIDLRRHSGVHPRVGATDVVPFVPIKGITMQDCARLARQLGKRVGLELAIPVFLYERAASHPDHAPLETVRRGGLEGLAFRMASDPDWIPDFGPPRLHETAGAIVIGARPPLIAFNVNLMTQDLEIAKSIAGTIRQSNGGVPHLKAIGVPLASRGMVQVAMNLTDFHVTPLHVAFEAVEAQASLKGVPLAGSEIVGLVPQDALVAAAEDTLRLEGFDRAQVLESRISAALAAAGPDKRVERQTRPEELAQYSFSELLDAVATATPNPAGGAVAALVSALSTSLGIMGARLSRQRTIEAHLLQIRSRLSELAQEDGEAYQHFVDVARRPISDSDRPAAISSSLHLATEIPLEIAERANEAGKLLRDVLEQVKPPVQSDLKVGIMLVCGGAGAALHTAKANLNIQPNQRLKEAIHKRILQAETLLEELKGLCYTPRPNLRSTTVVLEQASPGKAQNRKAWKSKSSITTSKKRSRSPRRNSRGKGSSES